MSVEDLKNLFKLPAHQQQLQEQAFEQSLHEVGVAVENNGYALVRHDFLKDQNHQFVYTVGFSFNFDRPELYFSKPERMAENVWHQYVEAICKSLLDADEWKIELPMALKLLGDDIVEDTGDIIEDVQAIYWFRLHAIDAVGMMNYHCPYLKASIADNHESVKMVQVVLLDAAGRFQGAADFDEVYRQVLVESLEAESLDDNPAATTVDVNNVPVIDVLSDEDLDSLVNLAV